jgi:1-acyl-sn-glycerol-3-phosphate acyltransferase
MGTAHALEASVTALALLSLGVFAARRRPTRPLSETLLHAVVRALVHAMYRFSKFDLHRIPQDGAALLVCNHVSFIDAFVIAAACRRPVRFVMHHRIYSMPVIHGLFRIGGVIPIAPAHEDEVLLSRAFERIDEELAAGELVCIFPEGKVTRDGQMNEFRTGVLRVLQQRPVPVVPMGLRGLWGSFFSRRHGSAMGSWPRRFWSKIELHCGRALPPSLVDLGRLESDVAVLADQPKPISSRNASEMSSKSTSSGAPSA